MRIACPKCAAEYEVPPAMIGGGKNVRCARCRTTWYVGAQPRPEPITTPAFPEAVGEAALATPLPHAATVSTLSDVAPHPAAEPPSSPSPEPFAPGAEVLPPATGPDRIAATSELASVDWEEVTDTRADTFGMADNTSDIRVERRGLAPVLAAWVLSLAVVAAGLAAAYHYRASVMDSWPPSRRLYATLGITR